MENLPRLKNLINEVDEVKANLDKIEKKQWNFSDSKIIEISRLLDELILEYRHIEE